MKVFAAALALAQANVVQERIDIILGHLDVSKTERNNKREPF